MTAPNSEITELESLLWRMRDGAIDEDGISRIETLVTGDTEVRRYFIRYGTLCGGLWWLNANSEGDRDSELGIQYPGFGEREHFSPFPPSVIDFSSLSSLPSLSTNFVGGPVFSYMVATVVLCAMLLSAWAYKITRVDPSPLIGHDGRSRAIDRERPGFVVVGQVTGMKDCRRGEENEGTMVGAAIYRGRKYAFSSGLMEITYSSGARVILEGPCEYKVDSDAGGSLQLGKLVARVQKRGERDGGPAANHSSLSTLHSPLFTISTPTAVVTDLGTEFGVEVDDSGNTTSRVFRGSVKVRVTGDGQHKEMVLHKNETARAERIGGSHEYRIFTLGETGTSPKFVRRMVEPPRQLDLLDIVAGGNGTGNRRERGIDPVTGMEDATFYPDYRGDTRQYQTVGWHQLIDGVFIPDGREGLVKTDSSGQTFNGFPPTNKRTSFSIWARAAEVKHPELAKNWLYWIYAMGSGEKYMPDRRGLLGMFSNSGITFDLGAMRRKYPDVAPSRLHAVAGVADGPLGPATPPETWIVDFWVIVDGKLMFKQEKLSARSYLVDVDVKLGLNDRFLTLAVTDSGGNRSGDRLVIGDPVLEMSSTTQFEPDSLE